MVIFTYIDYYNNNSFFFLKKKGLNYFHPHRFRSRAVVSYGPPVLIRPEWIQAYQKGGQAKREAVALLLEAGYHGLKGVTINAPNHNMLTVITYTHIF